MKVLSRAPVLAAALALSACASTSLDATWRDPTYEGPPFTKVLVVRAADDAAHRRIFEDALVREFRNRGVDAVASHTLIPDESDMRRHRLVEAAKASSADCVLSTRLLGIETKTTQVPVRSADAGSIDRYRRDSPGELQTTIRQDYRVANLESSLFDAGTGKMVWWGRTQTFPTTKNERVSRELGESVIKALMSAKLL